MKSNQGKILIGLLMLVVAVTTVAVVFSRPEPASAQMPPGMEEFVPGPPPDGPMGEMPVPPAGPGNPREPGQRMPDRPGGPGMMGPGMMPPMGIGGAVAITAADGFVYVVRGNTLYQFSAKTLKPVNKAELMPTPPGPVPMPE